MREREREGAPHIIKRCQNILQDLSINIVIDRHAAKRRNSWDWRILNVDSLFTEMPRGKIIKDLIFNLRIMIKITLYGWIEWAFKSLCSTRCSAEVTKAFNEIKTSEKLVFLLITCHLLRSILFSLSLSFKEAFFLCSFSDHLNRFACVLVVLERVEFACE